MKFLIYILLFFNISLPAQVKDTLKSPSILLGFNLQPSLTGGIFGSYSQEIDYEISPRFVLNAGFQTLIKIKRNWFLNSGISFTELGYKEIITDSWQKLSATRNIIHKDYYITTNVLAQYKFKKMYFGLGINASRFIISKKIENGKTNIIRGYSGFNGYSGYNGWNGYYSASEWDKWLFGLQGRIGIQMKINNNLYFIPEVFACSLRPIDMFLFGSKLHLNSGSGGGYFLTGINLTLHYKLK